MKHLKLFENESHKTYWIINDPGDSLSPFWGDDVTYLFDNQKDLLNFTLNRVYSIIKEHFDAENQEDNVLEGIFSDLDKCTNAEDVIGVLSDVINDGILDDFDRVLRLEATALDKNIQLKDWIELRRTAKKYNL